MLSETRTTIITLIAAFSFGGASLVPTVAQAYVMQEKPSLEPEYQPGGGSGIESEALPNVASEASPGGEASTGLERIETPPAAGVPSPPLIPIKGLKAERPPHETLLLAVSTKTCVVCE